MTLPHIPLFLHVLVICILLLLVHFRYADSIVCRIAVGQRGKLYENGLEWYRNCPHTKYCAEVITTDIAVVQKLFDYPFDSYYNEFYARTCGGDLGMPLEYHPYRDCSLNFRMSECRDPTKGLIKIDITTPIAITGHGGTEEMTLKYLCRSELCFENAASSTLNISKGYYVGVITLMSLVVALLAQ